MPPGNWPRGMRPGQSPAQMRGSNMLGQGQSADGMKRGADAKARSNKGYFCNFLRLIYTVWENGT